MTYSEALQYLASFINYERLKGWPYQESLKINRIRDFLFSIGNPQDALRCIHVAGSKGKGSTCAFIAYILKEAGYSVGLYTSPHLSDFRERIRILTPRFTCLALPRPASPARLTAKPWAGRWQAGAMRYEFEGMISKKELVGIAAKLKPAIDKFNKTSQYGSLSFFEVYTAIAFTYFKEKKVDFVVLETGMGGRLDATNTARSLACVITPISYEHTDRLGDTLSEIAAEKAGIIKRQPAFAKALAGCPPKRSEGGQKLIVISAPQEKEAESIIRKRCKSQGARLYRVGKDITYKKENSVFSIKGIFDKYNGLKINLLGRHQLINASSAVAAVEALRLTGVNVDSKAIRQGLFYCRWPARCEVISRNPYFILDGAQNIASVKLLKKAIGENFKYKRLILILGISSDKDKRGMCRELGRFADEIILTRADNPRAAPPEELAGYLNHKSICITQGVKEASSKARHLARKEDLILACGSLFVAGELRNEILR